MRGRRRTLAAVLAETLGARARDGRGAALETAISTAFAEACGPRLAREASFRGVMLDGRLLVVVRSDAWATQVKAVAPDLCARVNARLGRRVADDLDVRVAPER